MKQPLRAPGSKTVEVRGVHANAGVSDWYRKQLQCLLFRVNRSLILHIEAAWKINPPSIGFAQDAPNPSILLRRALKKWGGLWTKKFDRLSLDLSRQFAKKSFSTTQGAMQDALKTAGFTVAFTPSPASVEAYHAVVAENVALIKSIPSQYLKDVQTSVWSSVMKGADMAELTKTIQEKYGISHRRAAFIARDQSNKAKAQIEDVRRAELGIRRARWKHSGGGKTPRPEHVAFSGKIYEIGKGAYLEGKWVWPGSEPNCRCTSKSLIRGLDADA